MFDAFESVAHWLGAVADFIVRLGLGVGFLGMAVYGAWRMIVEDGETWGWLVVLAAAAIGVLFLNNFRSKYLSGPVTKMLR